MLNNKYILIIIIDEYKNNINETTILKMFKYLKITNIK